MIAEGAGKGVLRGFEESAQAQRKMLSMLGQMKPMNVHPYSRPMNTPRMDMPNGEMPSKGI